MHRGSNDEKELNTMAEGKNTILVYKDWKDIFLALSDANAGKLAKHFFQYVNDDNPDEQALSGPAKMGWIPIKATLKRDLKSWEKKVEKQSDAGALGNLKRWNRDLYLKVVAEEMDLSEAVSIAKHRKTSGSDKPDSGGIGSVGDKDRDTDRDKEKDKLNGEAEPPAGEFWFRLYGRIIKQKISEYFPMNFSSFLAQWQMKNDRESGRPLTRRILAEMDERSAGYTFRDPNHLQNSFLSTYEKHIKGKPEKTAEAKPTYTRF